MHYLFSLALLRQLGIQPDCWVRVQPPIRVSRKVGYSLEHTVQCLSLIELRRKIGYSLTRHDRTMHEETIRGDPTK